MSTGYPNPAALNTPSAMPQPRVVHDFTLSSPQYVERRPGLKKNVGEQERLVSMVAGGMLAGAGLGTRGLLSLGLLAVGGSLLYRSATGHCSLYNKLGLSSNTHRPGVRASHGVRVRRSIHIQEPPEKVSAAWGELTNLPQVMQHLDRVTPLGENRTHWVAKVMGMNFEWDAETTHHTPGKLIEFRSLPGGDIDCEGAVKFDAALQGGTNLKVEMTYEPPAGAFADKLVSFFGCDLGSQIESDLRRFKQNLEAGEVPTTAGQPHGR